MLELAEIAAQLGAGLARGAFHDGDDAGYGHDDIPPTRRPREGGGRCRQCKTLAAPAFAGATINQSARSEEHTSELQSLMRISYAVFSLRKKKKNHLTTQQT